MPQHTAGLAMDGDGQAAAKNHILQVTGHPMETVPDSEYVVAPLHAETMEVSHTDHCQIVASAHLAGVAIAHTAVSVQVLDLLNGSLHPAHSAQAGLGTIIHPA